MADYLVQEEDGTSRFELEEGGGFILLEESTEAEPFAPPLRVITAPTRWALGRV